MKSLVTEAPSRSDLGVLDGTAAESCKKSAKTVIRMHNGNCAILIMVI